MKKTIYINGFRASRADLRALLEWVKKGKTQIKTHYTKSGNLAIITED